MFCIHLHYFRDPQENMTLETAVTTNIVLISEDGPEVETVTQKQAVVVHPTENIRKITRKQMKKNVEPRLMKKDPPQINQ